MPKAVGYEVEKSQSISVSGKQRVTARLDAKISISGKEISGSVGREAEHEQIHSMASEPLELDLEDINDMIDAAGHVHDRSRHTYNPGAVVSRHR